MASSGPGDAAVRARLANVRYAEKDYWDNRYKSQPCAFDWFYGYTALRKLVRTFIKRSKLVLHVGCGNSNFQEGMAKDGYQVVNTDISEVVIAQMKAKHQHISALRYVVSDCRSMPEFLDCQFGSVIDKGTVDALLCSKDAAENIRSMFSEISRVLIPGGVFLLITLGGPAQRLALVNQTQFGWTVQVCLVRRVAEDQYAPSEPGRAIPLNDTAKSLSFVGPLEVQSDGSIAGLPEPFEPSLFFYAYVCRKAPLVLASGREGDGAARVRLPEGWRATVKAVAQAVKGEVGLPQGILSRGRRVKTTSRATFERELREREERQQQERQQAMAALASSLESLEPPADDGERGSAGDDVGGSLGRSWDGAPWAGCGGEGDGAARHIGAVSTEPEGMGSGVGVQLAAGAGARELRGPDGSEAKGGGRCRHSPLEALGGGGGAEGGGRQCAESSECGQRGGCGSNNCGGGGAGARAAVGEAVREVVCEEAVHAGSWGAAGGQRSVQPLPQSSTKSVSCSGSSTSTGSGGCDPVDSDAERRSDSTAPPPALGAGWTAAGRVGGAGQAGAARGPPPLASTVTSYGRLSMTVQDAFAVLDAVDGEGYSAAPSGDCSFTHRRGVPQEAAAAHGDSATGGAVGRFAAGDIAGGGAEEEGAAEAVGG